MQIRSGGIDLGKTTFHVVALNAAGKVLLRKKFTQKREGLSSGPGRNNRLSKINHPPASGSPTKVCTG